MQRVHTGIVLAFLLLAFWSATVANAQPGPLQQTGSGSQLDSRGFDLFEAGQHAHQLGRIAEAISLYDQAIALEPELWTAHYQRGVALLQLGNASDAEASLKKAIAIEGEFAAAHAALGDALTALDRLPDAEKELVRALQIDPALAAARISLAGLYWRRQAYADVDRELSRLEADHKATPDTLVLHGQALERLNKPQDAVKAYSSALDLDARHFDARVARGRLLAAQGDKAGAIVDYSAAVALRPDGPVRAELDKLKGVGGDPTSAIVSLEERVKTTPSDLAARRALIDAYARAGRSDDARKAIAELIELAPKDADSYDVAGDAVLTDAPLDAARYYVQAVRLSPDNVEFRLKLGSALVRAARYDAAIEHLAFAVERAPDRREGHAGLGAAFYGVGRYADAAREFAWLSDHDPASAAAYFFLGASLDRIGECLRAQTAFQKFLTMADAARDKRQIDEVNLRLPGLQRQIDRGECAPAVKKRG